MKQPRLGDEQYLGQQTRIYTERGWVVVENHEELAVERRRLKAFLATERGR